MIALIKKWRLRASKKAPVTEQMDQRSSRALAILVLLTQLPHILHLPVWVSAVGVLIVVAKLLENKPGLNRFTRFILSPVVMTLIAFGGALLIRWHYQYFLGRDPCVAFLFILVSAKFAEMRKPADATLLLCLAGFLLLTQYFYSQSILSALITLPAVFALGNALAVIRDPHRSHSHRKNMGLIARLLVQGAPLAILLFIAFPRLPGPLWSLPHDANARTGLSDSMAPGAISQLSLSDEVAFRVEFEGEIPAKSERYWRGPVLSQFDGRTWSVDKNQMSIRPAVDAENTTQYTVMLQPNQQRWLLGLDHPVSLPVSASADGQDARVIGKLTQSLQLISLKPITQVLRYKQQSLASGSFPSPMLPDISLSDLPGANPKAAAFALKLRSSAINDRAYIQSILRHFNQEQFHYTLQPTLLGNSPVDEFLFNTRNGFCEHYASAFVVLLRAAAIPARVVTGYQGGEMNGDYMIVRQSDAHAWAEAYIDGRWQRFDPTAAVAPSRVDAGMASALSQGEPVPAMAQLGSNWLKSLQLGLDKVNHNWQRWIVDFNNDTQATFWKKMGFVKPQLWQISTLVLLVTGLWCLLVLGLPKRKRSTLSNTDKLWQRYCQLLKQRGFERGTSEPATDFIERVASNTKHHQTHITQLGKDIHRLRFERLTEQEQANAVPTIKQQLRQLALKQFLHYS